MGIHTYLKKSNWLNDTIKEIKKYVVNYHGDNNFSPRVESFPCVRIMPNPRGGCFLFRDEKVDDKSTEYYKLGYLER